MDTTIKLSCHNHSLTLSSGFAFRCHWCKIGGYIRNGYHCTECDMWFHKDCSKGELAYKINHTSHPEHLLTRFPSKRFVLYRRWLRMCNVCKRRIQDDGWAYLCFPCLSWNLHESCAREPPPLTIIHPQVHVHPLLFYPVSRNEEHICEVCKTKFVGKLAYRCYICMVVIHVECVNSPEVNHLYHPKHSLKLLTCGAPYYTDDTCLLCGLKMEGVLYHCAICNFSVCLYCEKNPPPADVEHLKTHEHKLTLMARRISFTCNACGMQGHHSPYFCLLCDFMIHQSCIGLPHVININRHDHRISHTQELSFGDYVCMVCLQRVNTFYGAYSCSVCNYVVHLQCATRNDVWDGLELEGVPEETKLLKPFEEVGDNLINHFSHEGHYLKLVKDGTTHAISTRCRACMLPIYSDPVYSCDPVYSNPVYNCEKCDFVLHKVCANLLPVKRHMLHNKPFTLHVGDMDTTRTTTNKSCSACGKFFDGFSYKSDNVILDISCSLIPEVLFHGNHKHHLRYNETCIGKCDACQQSIDSSKAFSCEQCGYNLHFRCVSLPKTVRHVCDEHLLYLSCKENNNASVKRWCDICEEEMDPNKWFYTCNECEVTTHVTCVRGDFSYLKPGSMINLRRHFEVISNNHKSRPICFGCGLRCMVPFILRVRNSSRFICSERCFNKHY